MIIAMTVVLPAPVASFERQAHQFRVGVPVRGREVLKDPLALLRIGRDLGEPDGGFHGLDLAEERTDAAEFVIAPMVEQAGGFRRHLPLVRVAQVAPLST